MLQKLALHLNQHFPFLKESKVFIAVSGGMDSMVLLAAMKELEYDFEALHCNFGLRGSESDGDQHYVERFCEANNISVTVAHFDTEAFASEYKLSIQVAARKLRYEWFYEQLTKRDFDYVLTAHHADDDLETFMINLSRGTGIEGLTGIPAVNDKVIRPLLAFSRDEIEDYAKSIHLSWREDSSNASDKYLRNKIRHNLTPILKDINPEFLSSLQTTQNYLEQTKTMAEDAAVLVFQQVAQYANDEIHFNLQQLLKLPNYQSYLYHWLREYGFTAWDDIYKLVGSQTGKQILTPNYRLIKNRHFFILSPLKNDDLEVYEIASDQLEVNIPLRLSLKQVDMISDTSDKAIFVDEEKLTFPLHIRKRREGDIFFPFGMDGKSKKVSKIFKDEKMSMTDKDNTWLLCSGSQIVWVIGVRADDRFKVDNKTKQIIKIALT